MALFAEVDIPGGLGNVRSEQTWGELFPYRGPESGGPISTLLRARPGPEPTKAAREAVAAHFSRTSIVERTSATSLARAGI